MPAPRHALLLALIALLSLLGPLACSRQAPAPTDTATEGTDPANGSAGKGVTWPIPGMEHYVPAGKSGAAEDPPPGLPQARSKRVAPPLTRELGTHDLLAQRNRARDLLKEQPYPEALDPTTRPPATRAPYGGGVQVLAPLEPSGVSGASGASSSRAALAPAPTPEPAAAKPQPANVAAGKQGLFWGVRSVNATVFLLGSVHLTRGDIYPLRSEISNAFRNSDTLVVEADISDTAKLSGMVAAKGMYPSGETIRDHISSSTLKALTDYGDSSGMPMMMLEQMKPWLAAMTLQTMELQKLGYASSMGIDAHFMQLAKNSKRIVQLESADEQLNLLSRASPRVQEMMLAKTIEGVPKLGATMNTLMNAWQQGDESATEKLALDGMDEPEFRSLYETIYLDRNRKMATAIRDLLRGGGTYFVVVGAGHMVGKNGIVDLLRKSGHEVPRI